MLEKCSFIESASSEESENDPILKHHDLVDGQHQLECFLPYRREFLSLLEKTTSTIGILEGRPKQGQRLHFRMDTGKPPCALHLYDKQ